jgi:hypothetical protein
MITPTGHTNINHLHHHSFGTGPFPDFFFYFFTLIEPYLIFRIRVWNIKISKQKACQSNPAGFCMNDYSKSPYRQARRLLSDGAFHFELDK